MIGRQIRELQTFVPFLPVFKFSAWNFVSAKFGWRIDRDFQFLSRLRPFNLALDIGGNWGQSIIALRRTADPRRILSFEPNQMLAARLASRYRDDPSVEVQACGLGDEPGQFPLYVPFYRNYEFDGLASIDPLEAFTYFNEKRMARFDRGKLPSRSINVTVRCLDEFELAPDIVKMDVQGLELQVVRGGYETFRRHRPVTIIENPPKELVDLLGRCGLEPYHYDGECLSPYRWQWKNALFLTREHLALSGIATRNIPAPSPAAALTLAGAALPRS